MGESLQGRAFLVVLSTRRHGEALSPPGSVEIARCRRGSARLETENDDGAHGGEIAKVVNWMAVFQTAGGVSFRSHVGSLLVQLEGAGACSTEQVGKITVGSGRSISGVVQRT